MAANYYKVNIDYIKPTNWYLASFPEIPQLTATGSNQPNALTALIATLSFYTASGGYLPYPLSYNVTY